MPHRFHWKYVAVGGLVLGGLAAVLRASHKSTPPKRVALIGDSYAVGLGPELTKLFPTFKYEGHESTRTDQWAHHTAACGSCGDWLTAFKPDVVLVALGVNDNPVNPTNYQTIVRGLHGLGARVVWIKPPVQRVTNALHDAINSLGVQIVPSTSVPLASDGLHPTGVGYRTWAEEIATVANA